MRMLLGIKWYQFVQNDDVRRLTKQPKLTAIIQSRRLTLFGHIMCMDNNADAKRILLASPLAYWRRQLGRPRIMWLRTVQPDLKQHLTLPEAADLAQNRPLWRMMSAYGATQSRVACQKRRLQRLCNLAIQAAETNKSQKSDLITSLIRGELYQHLYLQPDRTTVHTLPKPWQPRCQREFKSSHNISDSYYLGLIVKGTLVQLVWIS